MDLLALGIFPRVECDWYLENTDMTFQDLGCEFRLEIEMIGTKLDIFKYRTFENLVACFHIREVQVTEHV